MTETQGLNHLGLSVLNLEKRKRFFTDVLGWEEAGYAPFDPGTMVSDGN